MAGFMKEFNSINEEAKAEPLPPGFKEVRTTDGKSILVNTGIWDCYMAQGSSQIGLPLEAAKFLFRLLTGELTNCTITNWVKQ